MKPVKTLSCVIVLSFGMMACRQGGKEEIPESKNASVYPGSIGHDTAKRYVQQYFWHAGVVHRKNTSIMLPNTRCVWFGKKQLDSLLKQLDAEKGDGIRFYLATYDASYQDPNKHCPPQDYWGYNTLVMVSTKERIIDEKKYHWDYYTDGQANGHPFPGQGFMVVPENDGELCPPPANCHDIGATLLDN